MPSEQHERRDNEERRSQQDRRGQFTLCKNGRIAMVSTHGYVSAEPQFGKPDTGGQVVYVLEVAKAMRDLGCQVDVITRQFEGQPEVDDMGENLRVLRIPFGGDEFIVKENFHDILPEFIDNFLKKIDEESLSYALMSSHYWDAGVGAQAVAEKLGIPHVHTPHSLGKWKKELMSRDMPDADTSVYRFAERIEAESKMYAAADFLIATTAPQSDRMIDWYDLPEEKTTVLPAGLDDARFYPMPMEHVEAIREKHDIRAHDILTLGRMARNKGNDLLIEAFPMVLETVRDARLLMYVGAETEQDEKQINALKQLAARLGVHERVEWRGYASDEDLADIYRAPGVFAMPSRYEPFGMTAVEAMACGTPTVITAHGGLMEQVKFGTHALFADPKIPGEFATQLSMPLRYSEVADRLRELGPKWARKEFAWSGIAEKMLTKFEQRFAKQPAST
ncbi:MAG: glycosyltransferase [Planctomycetota bacterium]